MTLRILVWNENVHETEQPQIAAIYPAGIHGAIADGLRELRPDAVIETATLADAEHGLSESRLAQTDVLAEMAERRRPRGRLDRRSRSSHCGRRSPAAGDRQSRDVRRVLRHPDPR